MGVVERQVWPQKNLFVYYQTMLMAFGIETVFKQITLFDHFGTIAMNGEGNLHHWYSVD